MKEISVEEKALAVRMAHEYAARRGGRTFHAPAVPFGGDSGTDAEPDYVAEARERATEYAAARNQNKRPLRAIDESDSAAKEGRESALAWLARRANSKWRGKK